MLLERLGNGSWTLIEVKSSTSVKPEHIDDTAIQLWVLEHCGLSIERVLLVHINNAYMHDGGAHDPRALFTLARQTKAVHQYTA